MSIYIDRKYLNFISPRLDRFTRKKDDLFQFRCPLCGDSHQNKFKARGFIFKKGESYIYRCHNCGITLNFYKLLGFIDQNLQREYSFESFKDKYVVPKKEVKEIVPNTKTAFREKLDLPVISEMEESHYAVKYVIGRNIPKSEWSRLYYAEDFKSFGHKFDQELKLRDKDPRLVIPFYNEKKELIAFQGRTLINSDMRYVTIKTDPDNPKVFGLDRIDKSKLIYVVEGPIDSLFLPNAIAIADANLKTASRYFPKDSMVLVFDNEPRNRDIIRFMKNAITEGFSVCIWPQKLKYKDVNDMISSGYTKASLEELIRQRTFNGLSAMLEFSNWNKLKEKL
jgi:transcription elongation factor Elf1